MHRGCNLGPTFPLQPPRACAELQGWHRNLLHSGCRPCHTPGCESVMFYFATLCHVYSSITVLYGCHTHWRSGYMDKTSPGADCHTNSWGYVVKDYQLRIDVLLGVGNCAWQTCSRHCDCSSLCWFLGDAGRTVSYPCNTCLHQVHCYSR